jgi:peptidyl-prolyl cis-trans isomerase SurA
MKRNVVLILLSVFLTCTYAQSDKEILLSIGGQDVTSEEFYRVYTKNSNITSESDKKSIDEYYDLFVNYKLKVIEAKNRGYDTSRVFIDEFSGYRSQLAKPYLEKSNLKDSLVLEAYERYKEEIEASHILVECRENSIPEDTLKAFQKIMAIHARVTGGEPFEQVARATSDDPSVKDNGGYLGFFSAFRMVYPFETGAYNTPEGQISGIIRTSFGYHIIKVHSRRPSRGSIKAAHIMVRLAEGASEPEEKAAEEKIQKAYLDLMEGKSWADAVKEYSENPRTKEKEGEIGWLRTGQAPEEFLGPCFAEETGSFTKPIKTRGGYHIGFVMEKRPIESFDEAKEKLTRRVERDNFRKDALENLRYGQLRNKYKVVINEENLESLFPLLDSNIYKGTWTAATAKHLTQPAFLIEDKPISTYDFAKYLATQYRKINKEQSFEQIVNEQLKEFANTQLYEYAIEQLPYENKDYKYLMKEYHDGILLFNLTNDLVWTKAQEDTLGLEKFYETASKYQWNERIAVNVYTYADNSYTTKLPALIKKQRKKKAGDEFLLKNLCPSDTVPCIKIESKVYEKSQDAMADKLPWEKGATMLESDDNSNYLYYITDIKGKEDKKLHEARGLYIADYQTYLEKEWIKELRDKYEVTRNDEVFNKLKSELN